MSKLEEIKLVADDKYSFHNSITMEDVQWLISRCEKLEKTLRTIARHPDEGLITGEDAIEIARDALAEDEE